jgi:TRAP-type C4-dicarboxylate transport system permease small subunit
MDRLNTFFRRFFATGAGVSMALVFMIIFVNSLRRYTLGKSVEWGEELPIYIAIYGVMFGFALAYIQDRHIRFTILTDFLSKRRRDILFCGVDLVMIAVGAALAWSGYAFATRRAAVDSSGLIGTAKRLVESTGIEGMIWIGRVSTYQFAIAVGGVFLMIAAFLKFMERRAALKVS